MFVGLRDVWFTALLGCLCVPLGIGVCHLLGCGILMYVLKNSLSASGAVYRSVLKSMFFRVCMSVRRMQSSVGACLSLFNWDILGVVVLMSGGGDLVILVIISALIPWYHAGSGVLSELDLVGMSSILRVLVKLLGSSVSSGYVIDRQKDWGSVSW